MAHNTHQHDGDHTHRHGHDHRHHHHHAPEITTDSERRVFLVMLLTGSYMMVQVVGGLMSGSLALLADAGHMLSDTAALGLAWVAFRLGRRPAGNGKSYGWYRFEVLAAFINGLALLVLCVWIFAEAMQRIVQPQPVLGWPMLVVAGVGLAVNIAGFLVLNRGDRRNLNLRGALLHVIGDMLGSVAAIAAAVIILMTGWTMADPILSVLVVFLILRSAWVLVRESGHILLEGAPENFDAEDIKRHLLTQVPEIEDVHHIHVWSLTAERTLVTLHVTIAPDGNSDSVLVQVHRMLSEKFGIEHATVQVERAACIGKGCQDPSF